MVIRQSWIQANKLKINLQVGQDKSIQSPTGPEVSTVNLAQSLWPLTINGNTLPTWLQGYSCSLNPGLMMESPVKFWAWKNLSRIPVFRSSEPLGSDRDCDANALFEIKYSIQIRLEGTRLHYSSVSLHDKCLNYKFAIIQETNTHFYSLQKKSTTEDFMAVKSTLTLSSIQMKAYFSPEWSDCTPDRCLLLFL